MAIVVLAIVFVALVAAKVMLARKLRDIDGLGGTTAMDLNEEQGTLVGTLGDDKDAAQALHARNCGERHE